MSGADNIVFNALEKPIAADLNNAQDLAARTLATVFEHAYSTVELGSETRRNWCGGLTVTSDGTNQVKVSAGVLFMDSLTLAPVLETYDSRYRIGTNFANISFPITAPVANKYYLLEVQVSSVVTSESRSVLNPSTGNFSSQTTPKLERRGVTFQLVNTGTATDYPPPSGGDWFVLAGVFVPAGGGVPSVVDMRLLRSSRPQMVVESFLRKTQGRFETQSGGILLDADCAGGGLDLYARTRGTGGALDPGASGRVDPTTTLAADTWYYLYLAPWRALAPRNVYGSDSFGIHQQGVLVLSAAVPSPYRTNSTPLTLPAPFNFAALAASNARLVCVLRRNTFNNGWVTSRGDADLVLFPAATDWVVLVSAAPASGAGGVPVPSVPAGVKTIIFGYELYPVFSGGFTGPDAYLRVRVQNTAGTVTYSEELTMIGGMANAPGSFPLHHTTVEVPHDSTGYLFKFECLANGGAGALVAGTLASVNVRGYRL